MEHSKPSTVQLSWSFIFFVLLKLPVISVSALSTPNISIYLVSIGASYERVRRLSHKRIEAVCPYDFAHNHLRGFTLECEYQYSNATALSYEMSSRLRKMTFAVNGLDVKVERRKPYFISGDVNGIPYPWHRYPNVALVSCLPNGRYENASSVTVVFSCFKTAADIHIDRSKLVDAKINESNNDESSDNYIVDLYFNEESLGQQQGFQTGSPMTTMTGEVLDQEEITMKKIPPPGTVSEVLDKMGKPRNSSWVGEVPTTASDSNIVVPSPLPKPHSVDNSSTFPPRLFEAATSPYEKVKLNQYGTGVGEIDCIVVDARRDVIGDVLTKGWTDDEERGGLTFRQDDWSESLTSAGQSPLNYVVTPQNSSRYALIIDMTTAKHSEHNDVWVRVKPGGIQAMRKGVDKKIKSGWVKGYHNKKGRAALVSTVDNKPHSLSTGVVLTKGFGYEVSISGRSSMVTLHRIIMFPCTGRGCMRSTKWNETLRKCSAYLKR